MHKADNNYVYVHLWLQRTFGKADLCENKDCKGKSKNFNYALIKGKTYIKDRSNFMKLCRSCHTVYDMPKEQLERGKLRLLEWAPKLSLARQKKVYLTHGQCKIALFESTAIAADLLGICRTSITNNLIGLSKSTNVGIFKFA